jgi:hypothetical protein
MLRPTVSLHTGILSLSNLFFAISLNIHKLPFISGGHLLHPQPEDTSCCVDSLTSICNSNTTFILKCHSQWHIKFINVVKVTFSVYSLLDVSASQGHHQTTANWLESLHCMGSHINVLFMLHCVSSCSWMYARAFLMLFSCCGFHAVFLCA